MIEPIKKSKRKRIMLVKILSVLLIGIGVTYAMFTYTKSGINNKLIAGDIYMRYKETSAINLSGAMPSSSYPDSTSGNYFEFEIIGKNTNTEKDITYNIKLAYGNQETGKNRIHDEYLLFKIVEVTEENNEEIETALVTDANYDDIRGAILYTGKVEKNRTVEYSKKYRIYARITEEVVIGNTNQTYTLQEWNNLYASIKINVDGGFVEETNNQELAFTSESCFTTSENQDGTLKITSYLYDEDICGTTVVIPETIDNKSVTIIGSNSFQDSIVTTYVIPDSIKTIQSYAIEQNNDVAYNVNIISNKYDLDDLYVQDNYMYPVNYQYPSNNISLNLTYNNTTEINNNKYQRNSYSYIASVTLSEGVTSVGDYAFSCSNGLFSLSLPSTLQTIGDGAFSRVGDGCPGDTGITELVLPNGLISIGYDAFNCHGISSLTIPDSVTTIGNSAFANNPLTFLSLGNNVETIGGSAFASPQCSSSDILTNISHITGNVIIPNSVTSIGYNAFATCDEENYYEIYNDDINLKFSQPCTAVEEMENYSFGVNHVFGNNILCSSN